MYPSVRFFLGESHPCVKTLGLDAKIGGVKCLGKAAANCGFITNFLANAMFNTACLSVISLIRANS